MWSASFPEDDNASYRAAKSLDMSFALYVHTYIICKKGGIIKRRCWNTMLGFSEVYACDISALMEQADEQ